MHWNKGKHNRRLSLVGQQFTKLTVVAFAGVKKGKYSLWECLCDCGKETVAVGSDLRRGHKKSCGCLHSDVIRQINKYHQLQLVLTIDQDHLMHLSNEIPLYF